MTARTTTIGDAAIAVLAERGMRGLTHRAVDEAAGLPTGSTSYYARTRAALLDVVLARLTELDLADGGQPRSRPVGSAAELAELVAGVLVAALTTGRVRTLARFELALEATRRPALRERYDLVGTAIRELAATALAAAGSTDPVRHGRMLLAWFDGVLFDSLVGAGGAHPPSGPDLRRSAEEFLRGMLG